MRALIILGLLAVSAGAWAAAFTVYEPAPLPEPGTLTLIAAGALAAFKLRRKK